MSIAKCILIDSYGFIFRAFHVQPPLISPNGVPVGAIYGFTSMLIKLLSEQQPTHIAAIFDTGGKTFRHELFSDYKAHRPEAPEELKVQFPLTRDIVAKLNITAIEQAGYEADDLLASYAKKLAKEDCEVIIVSSDKDLAQLLDGTIKIFDPVKAKFVTYEDIKDKFGVEDPKLIRDVLALIGDKSDNIPGIPGVGPKTAAELIAEFGDFNNLIAGYENIKSPRKKQLIAENLEQARLSWELVGLKDNMELPLSLEELKWHKPSCGQAAELVTAYGFKSLQNRLNKICSQEVEQFSLLPDMPLHIKPIIPTIPALTSGAELELLSSTAAKDGYLNILADKEAIILNCAELNFSINAKSSLFNDPLLTELLSDNSVLKITHDIKSLTRLGLNLNTYADLNIIFYILSAGLPTKTLPELCTKFLNIATDLEISNYCCYLKNLYDLLKTELFKTHSLDLYNDIDLPLSKILTKMEQAGVKFDIPLLAKLSQEFSDELISLEQKIYHIAGCEFNIGSPKQLGEILFDRLKLPGGKLSTKSKTYTTNANILEELSLSGVEIADYLLKWRQLAKLKNTYTDSLPKLVNPTTSRIHTTLLQTSTATGRLSSTEPNLQNIPIRTTEGNKIRSAIICEPGTKLISADYSQIELRILSQMAEIPTLQQAFLHGEDIHRHTASQVFRTSLAEVTPDQRRKAKAINFGIIYGISSFGLAKQLNISRAEAKQYIELYFAEYPGIEEYMKRTKDFAKAHGYVENLFGRRCYVPAINDSNHALRSFGERAAINAPIQGTSADIAKLAMIAVDKMLRKHNFTTRMILQVHDELIFEAPESELETVMPLIKKTMEAVVNFKVPLAVEVAAGNSWAQAH